MPFLDLASSPLAAGISPVRIHFRDPGAGCPLVVLHGGWGHDVYSFDRQVRARAADLRIVIPDRSGYGRSTPITSLPSDFHERAVGETRAVIGALRLDRPILWGHSDGAIIALRLALQAPEAFSGVIADATHLYRRKPGSRAFFESVIANPESLGPTVVEKLHRDHGTRWPQVVALHSRAWLEIADEASSDSDDFYGGRLAAIQVPVLVVHGARDPRTEPGELDALERALRSGASPRPDHQFHVLSEGGHSPHSERATADRVSKIVQEFLGRLWDRPVSPGSSLPAPLACPAPPAQASDE